VDTNLFGTRSGRGAGSGETKHRGGHRRGGRKKKLRWGSAIMFQLGKFSSILYGGVNKGWVIQGDPTKTGGGKKEIRYHTEHDSDQNWKEEKAALNFHSS